MSSLFLALTATLVASSPALALLPTPTAEILAGLSTDDSLAGADKASVPERHTQGVLEGYTKKVGQLWDTFEKRIAEPMREWSKTELQHTPGETIFYPFAGPDFPTVQILYPDAGRYVLVALQKGGRVPDLPGMRKDKLSAYLRTFRGGWESFTLRGFYDTDDLERDTAEASLLEGITPALMAFAVRLGYAIDKIEPVRVAASGEVEVHPGDRNAVETWDSVRLTLRARDGRTVLLDYLFIDLSDTYLGQHEGDRKLITALAGQRVVTKAASHLMQKSFFSIIRSAILNHAMSLWQDETGIDLAELEQHFTVVLYGKFTKANGLFLKGIQRALATAYRTRTGIKPLPYKVGYKKESGSCVQVALRKP